MEIKKFYRYMDFHFGVETSVDFFVYYLVKETLKGYWIHIDENYNDNDSEIFFENKYWVSKTSRKRFAYPTQMEAIESFIARKQRQIKILTKQCIKAKNAFTQGVREKEILKGDKI